MLKLEGLTAFIAVVEAGTFSEAARRLRISKSMVSQRVADLERSIGARLVQRTTRKLALTEDGVLFHRRALRIAADLTEATTELSERRGALVGPLRLSAPVSFGVLHLAPALYPFLRENPGLELTLDLDDRFVDAAAGGYDAVIRHGALRPSALVAKRLARSSRVRWPRPNIWLVPAAHVISAPSKRTGPSYSPTGAGRTGDSSAPGWRSACVAWRRSR